jgi:2-(1,2-epoxy-1,2-dihydrophenyl)acetyl-CoA isomerase
LQLGLATKVVKDGAALKSAIDMLDDLTKSSLHSFGWSKRLLNESFISGFETHLELEREGLADCADHPDGWEGLHAFNEKRKPEFNR